MNIVADERLALTGITVVDVEHATTVSDQTIIIAGDRIQKIGPATGSGLPTSVRVVDCSGLYVMPGLVDAHVHYLDAPVFGPLFVANGVVLVRDMGMPNEHIFPLRDALNRGDVLGPEMLAAGVILDGDPILIPPVSVSVKTPADGRAAVARQAEAGADMIKIYSNLSRDALLAVIDEAGRRGLKVVGHVPESVCIEDAGLAGLRSSEHPFGFDKVIARALGDAEKLHDSGMGPDMDYLGRLDEVEPNRLDAEFARIRRSGIVVCPTVVVFKAETQVDLYKCRGFAGSEFVSSTVLDTWKMMWGQQPNLPDFMWRNWARIVVMLHNAGVPLMVGTDLLTPGILPGISVHDEMMIWQEAGIPTVEVLRSATIVPARFLGRGDRLGSIAEGKTASMVLVRDNPLQDVSNAKHIEAVLLKGRFFDRKDLDGLIEGAKETVDKSLRPS